MIYPLTRQNAYKMKQENQIENVNFFSENDHLILIRSTFNPHTNKLYFHLFNKNNHYADFNEFTLPDSLSSMRCLVSETLFCDQSDYEIKDFTMSYKK